MKKFWNEWGAMTIVCVIGAIAFAVSLLTGCALERAEPAAKSARTTYGAISIVVSGDNSYCTYTMGDGAMTAADGDGATAQTTKQASTQNPEFSGATDPVSAGIQTVGKVAVAGIDAYTATHSKSGESAKADGDKESAKTAVEDVVQGCTGDDCNYETGECEGPDCEYVE
jgi:hypothetical protein